MSALATRTRFTEQLNEVEDLVTRLADKASADVRAAGLAACGDGGAGEGVLAGRKAEDRLRNAIEQTCLDIMLLQQPLIGDDLRFVTGSFRVVSDLSHIDAMTRDVAFLSADIPGKAASKLGKEFQEMSEATADMLSRAVAAFCGCDADLAQQVFDADERVNTLYHETEEKLVAFIRSGKSPARHLPELLMVAKYFERIGDLSKRVAAWAIFRVTGEHTVAEKHRDVDAEDATGGESDD